MSVAWTPDALADDLLSRRDELRHRLPRRIRSSRRLSEDQLELVVDDAVTFVAVHYEAPISSSDEAERVFWHAAELRVMQALDRRRRRDTVRGRFERTDEDALEDVPDSGTLDPAEITEEITEHAMAAEFAATLDAVETAVLRRKWLIDPAAQLPRGHKGSEPLGWRALAEQLDLPARRVRAAERSIAAKLDRFAALIAAGRLCQQRAADLEAVASGVADPMQSNLAHAHLEHCATCKADFVMQLRAVRSAAFARKVAALLPPVPLADHASRGRVREMVADWVSSLLGHGDGASIASQASASGVGRGAGGALALKAAALLAGGAATIGATSGVLDHRSPSKAKPKIAARPTSTPRPTPTPTPLPTQTATPEAKAARAAVRKAAKRRKAATRARRARAAAAQEQAPVSPAPSGSQPNGVSEFTPDSSNLPAAAPAPAPTASGASEFP